jgi:hypothetical protein
MSLSHITYQPRALPPAATPPGMPFHAAAAPPSPSWSASPGRQACTSPLSRCRRTAARLTWHAMHSNWRRSWQRCCPLGELPAGLLRRARQRHQSSSCRQAGSRPRRPCPKAALPGPALPGSSSSGRTGWAGSSSSTITSSSQVLALQAGNPHDSTDKPHAPPCLLVSRSPLSLLVVHFH